MKRLLFDIETDGLLDEVTKVHCIVTLDLDTGDIHSYHGSDVMKGAHEIEAAAELWGHNIIGYDLPVLRKLYGMWCNFAFEKYKIRDTLVCSQHLWLELKQKDFVFRKKTPDFPGNLIGSHSLKAWGWRLGEKKDKFGEDADWSTFTPEMLEYCIQDVKVNKKLIDLIVSKKYSEAALDNEMRFAHVIHLQEQHGFRFDREHAVKLYGTLAQRRNTLELELQKVFPGWYEEMKQPEYFTLTYTDVFGATTSLQCPSKGAAEDERKARGIKPKACVIEPGPLKKKHTPFNPGSHDHIAKVLIEKYGWKPEEYGDDGKPSTTEEVLQALKYPEIPLIIEYLLVEKRIGQLAEGNLAWLKLEKNGRIHGRVNTNGTVSTRCTHSNPNMSQIPSCDKPFGKECRALFVPDVGHSLVGVDASGIQLRALSHYLHRWDKGAYGEIVLNGDIHEANRKAAGFQTRQQSKRFIYAWLLGAGPAKIGEIAGTNAKHGKELQDRFLESFPALGELKAAVAYAVKTKGYLTGLDGRILPCRSEHAALSSLLQGFEACVHKVSVWNAFQKCISSGYQHGTDFSPCVSVHDEVQWTARKDIAEQVGQILVNSIKEAGELLGSKCPLAGECKIGDSWSATH